MRKFIGYVVLLGIMAVPLAMKLLGAPNGPTVNVEAAQDRALKATILASGSIDYDAKVQLSPEIIGRVTRVLVKEGDHVEAGQMVLMIDDKTLKAQVAQSEAELRIKRIAIDQQAASLSIRARQNARLRELVNRGFATPSNFDDQKYAYDVTFLQLRLSRESFDQARAALQQVREQLTKSVVKAPMSGIVTAINIKAGETAVPSTVGIAGSSLMTIADPDTLMAEINIDEADVASVRPGQSVRLSVLAYPMEDVHGVIRSIQISPRQSAGLATGSGSQARLYPAKVSIAHRSGMTMRPGMSCRAEIAVSSKSKALAVPIQAVLNDDDGTTTTSGPSSKAQGGSYVIVAEGGRARRRPVRTGLSDDNYQEIDFGLKRGDRVVVGPAKQLRFLRDGETIVESAEKTAT